MTIVKFEASHVLARLIAILSTRHDVAPHDDIIIASLSILRQMAKLSRPFLDDHPDQARLLLRQLCAFLTRQNEPHVQLLAIQLLVRWLERANNELIMASIEDNGTIVALLAASLAKFDHHGT